MKQFKSLLDLLRTFPDEQSCIDYLEKQRWPEGVISPFDVESKVYRCAGNKFKCKRTGKKFTVTTGTIFENTNLPLQKWFIALYLFTSLKRGISSHQLARDLDVTQATAWFVLERLRDAFEQPAFLKKLQGVVQVDETFVGGKNKNRHRDKKVDYTQDRVFSDKVAIWGGINEEGMVRCVAIPDVKKMTILPLVYKIIREDSIVVTDEWKGYMGMNDKYWREVVDHGRKQYMNDSGFTTNKMESCWSHLKRTINGTYIKVSRKHMQRYCNEFTFRWNTKNLTIQERFDMVLGNAEGRLKYTDLVIENKTRYEYR